MRRCVSILFRLAVVSLLLVAAGVALADGGLVRISERSGAFLITAFTSPTPVRAGTLDLSVMVQDARTLAPVLDARVDVHLVPAGGAARTGNDAAAATVRLAAVRDQATNKLLYAALPALPASGEWEARIGVERADDRGEISFRFTAEPAVAPLLSYWALLALPAVGVALFVLNRRLARGAGGRR